MYLIDSGKAILQITHPKARSSKILVLMIWTSEVYLAEMYSEPSQILKIESFAKKANGSKLLTIFVKSSILDVQQGSEYAFAGNLQKIIEDCVSLIYGKQRNLDHESTIIGKML